MASRRRPATGSAVRQWIGIASLTGVPAPVSLQGATLVTHDKFYGRLPPGQAKGPVLGRSRLGLRFQRVNGRNRFWFGPRHGCRIIGARYRRNGGHSQPPWSSNFRLVPAATPWQRSPIGRPFNAQALAVAVNVGGVVTTPKGFGGRVTRPSHRPTHGTSRLYGGWPSKKRPARPAPPEAAVKCASRCGRGDEPGSTRSPVPR